MAPKRKTKKTEIQVADQVRPNLKFYLQVGLLERQRIAKKAARLFVERFGEDTYFFGYDFGMMVQDEMDLLVKGEVNDVYGSPLFDDTMSDEELDEIRVEVSDEDFNTERALALSGLSS